MIASSVCSTTAASVARWFSAQLKKMIAVAVASRFVRSCPARATGTTIAAMIAA